MTYIDILRMVLSALIGIIVTAGITLLLSKLRESSELIKIMSSTGLRYFLPTDKFARLDILEKALRDGQAGDEILVIGRTLRWLVEDQRNLLIDGLEGGMNLKILILNPEKVRNQTIGLDPLQLKDPETIFEDLKITLNRLRNICEEAQSKKYLGSLDVRVCDYIIWNTLTSITQARKALRKPLRRVIFDFSFSTNRIDKYQQYYECDPNKEDHFVNKLYRLYSGSFDDSQVYLKYDELILYNHASLLRENIEQKLGEIVLRYDEGEELRSNQSRNLLNVVPRLLASVHESQPASPPLSVQFELNNQCNTKCRHCMRHTWPTENVLSTQSVKEIIEQLTDIGVKTITFSGGEPTLRTDFPEILSYSTEKGLQVGILTNGLQLDQFTATEIANHADWVRISVDAANDQTYLKVRGVKDGIAPVVESIKNLVEARRQSKRFCRIGVCYSLQAANIAEAGEMVEFVKTLGLGMQDKVLTFKFVHGQNGFLNTPQQLAIFRRTFLEHSDPILDRWTNLPYLRRFLSEYSNENDIATGQPLQNFYKQHSSRCYTPYLFSMIDAYGDVYPCCFMYYDNERYEKFREKREKYRMGQLTKTPFAKIWQGEAYSRFRNDVKNIDIDLFRECQECTRHFMHNSFLSEVTSTYEYYEEEYGSEAGKIFQQVLQQNRAGEVWL